MHTTSEQASVGAIIRLGKELYLSVFVLFYRAVALFNTPYGNAQTGAIGVAILEWILCLCLFDWVQIMSSKRVGLPIWAIAVVYFSLYIVNHIFLISRGSGVAFERQFNDFPKGKRIALRLSGLAVISIIVLIFSVSAAAYHQAFNIHVPTGF